MCIRDRAEVEAESDYSSEGAETDDSTVDYQEMIEYIYGLENTHVTYHNHNGIYNYGHVLQVWPADYLRQADFGPLIVDPATGDVTVRCSLCSDANKRPK